jgi:hypothetical protein
VTTLEEAQGGSPRRRQIGNARSSPRARPSRQPGIAVNREDGACERGANISQSTRVHARVTCPSEIPRVCGGFVVALTRQYPRFPALSQDGKEGVDGSSPSEGFREAPAKSAFVCRFRQRLSRTGTRGHVRTFARCSHDPPDSRLSGRVGPPAKEASLDPLASSQKEVDGSSPSAGCSWTG